MTSAGLCRFGRQVVTCAGACSANCVESRYALHQRGASESQGTHVIISPFDAGSWSPKCGDLVAELVIRVPVDLQPTGQ